MAAARRLRLPVSPDVATGGEVVLEAPTGEDAADITHHCQDAAIQEWTTVPSPYHPTHARDFLASVERGWAEGSEFTWAIREGGQLVGMVGLAMQPIRSAEIGYWLAPARRLRGVMSGVLGAVVEHAFAADGLDLDRLFWQAFVGNIASRRAAEKAGFSVDGWIRGGGVQRGLRRDVWVGTLLRSDPRTPRGTA